MRSQYCHERSRRRHSACATSIGTQFTEAMERSLRRERYDPLACDKYALRGKHPHRLTPARNGRAFGSAGGDTTWAARQLAVSTMSVDPRKRCRTNGHLTHCRVRGLLPWGRDKFVSVHGEGGHLPKPFPSPCSHVPSQRLSEAALQGCGARRA
jgi:hypothetical protein